MATNNTITITLTVDTKDIQPKKVDEYVTFSDGQHHPKGQSLEDFTTTVKKNMEVEWRGVPEEDSEGNSVSIDKIVWHKGGEVLKGKDHHGQRGHVKAQVREHYIKEEEKYIVHFSVFNEGKNKGEFKIDPKLTMAKE